MDEQQAAERASAKETIASISDEQLFRNALAPEPSPPPQQPPAEPSPPPQAPAQPGEPPRDERGRFTKGEQQTSPPAAPGAPQALPPQSGQAPPAPTPDDVDVPAWRHREIREERDQHVQRARQLEALLMDQQRQFHALQAQIAQQAPRPPEQVPDMVMHPEQYHAYVQNQFNERMRNMEANFSFRLAHQAHGELFERAFGEMIQRAERGDPSIAQSVMRSPDPGAAMVNWYSREQTLARVGNDPEAWFEQQLGERLKDQKYAGQLLERMRGGAQQQQAANGGPAPVELPPSLNRVAAAAPVDVQAGDMSNDSLFDFAFRQGRTRR